MRFLVGALLLSACVSQPGSDMTGATRTEVVRESVQYVVLQKGEVVEIRPRFRFPLHAYPKHRPTMIKLMSEVTGCRLRETSLQGIGQGLRGTVACD